MGELYPWRNSDFQPNSSAVKPRLFNFFTYPINYSVYLFKPDMAAKRDTKLGIQQLYTLLRIAFYLKS
jgi:hypothetical protein